MTSDVQWQNYLSEITDAVLIGDPVEDIHMTYGIAYRDDKFFIDLIEQLDDALVTVEPTKQFSNRLKNELMGIEHTGVVGHIRRLPARVQWAAIVAAAIGGVLIVIQRLTGAGDSLQTEERQTIPDES